MLRKLNLNSTHLSPLTFETLKVRLDRVDDDNRCFFVHRKSCPLCKNAIFDIRMLGEDHLLVVYTSVNVIFSRRISLNLIFEWRSLSLSPLVRCIRSVVLLSLLFFHIALRESVASPRIDSLSLFLTLCILSPVRDSWVNDSPHTNTLVYSIGFPSLRDCAITSSSVHIRHQLPVNECAFTRLNHCTIWWTRIYIVPMLVQHRRAFLFFQHLTLKINYRCLIVNESTATGGAIIASLHFRQIHVLDSLLETCLTGSGLSTNASNECEHRPCYPTDIEQLQNWITATAGGRERNIHGKDEVSANDSQKHELTGESFTRLAGNKQTVTW